MDLAGDGTDIYQHCMHLVRKLDCDVIILNEVRRHKGRVQQSELKKAIMKNELAEHMSERTFYSHLEKMSCGEEYCDHEPAHPLRRERKDRFSYYSMRLSMNELTELGSKRLQQWFS